MITKETGLLSRLARVLKPSDGREPLVSGDGRPAEIVVYDRLRQRVARDLTTNWDTLAWWNNEVATTGDDYAFLFHMAFPHGVVSGQHRGSYAQRSVLVDVGEGRPTKIHREVRLDSNGNSLFYARSTFNTPEGAERVAVSYTSPREVDGQTRFDHCRFEHTIDGVGRVLAVSLDPLVADPHDGLVHFMSYYVRSGRVYEHSETLKHWDGTLILPQDEIDELFRGDPMCG